MVRGALGILSLIAVAWLLSSDRRRFPVRIVLGGLALQWALALAVLKTETGRVVFDVIARAVLAVLGGADEGASFVFGELAGGHPAVAWHAIAGIKIMTTIIVVATLSEVGFHYGVLQRIVAALAGVLRRTMNISGAESLAGAANVFFGQTEAPLLVRPYIAGMSRSELMALMTGGFATVAAGVMAVYVSILSAGDPDMALAVARHLLTACLMSAPAAFVIAKIMIPPAGTDDSNATASDAGLGAQRETHSLIDAMTRGASQGMTLAINVLAMLIAFIAAIAILDTLLIAVGNLAWIAPLVNRIGLERLDLDGLFGLAFSGVAWLIGADGTDLRPFGSLLGKAMATTELIAYDSLSVMDQNGTISKRSVIMATYCLCGFANISSIGIQIGGIGGLVPERRADLVRLGPRAMLGGAMACWMTGCIAGMLIDESAP